MADPIRILHLSDLHFGAGDSQATVMIALAHDVATLARRRPPDLVAITGDVAHDGKEPSYRIAEKWLLKDLVPRVLGFPAEATLTEDQHQAVRKFVADRLLVVPGNHDVNLADLSVEAQGPLDKTLRRAKVEECPPPLPSIADLGFLKASHAQYFDFLNRIGVWKGTHVAVDSAPWWRRSFDELSVQVLGICSSWMCRGHDEPGSLLIGQRQLDELLQDVPRAKLTVAMVHHPWQFFEEKDGEAARRRLGRECDLILRGHLHEGRAFAIETPDCRWIELEAGAGTRHRNAPNAYQLIEFFPDTLKVSAHYRLWQRDRWIPDENCYRATSDGRVDLYLHRRSPGRSDLLDVSEPYHDGRQYRIVEWQRENCNALSDVLLVELTAAIADAPPNSIIVLAGSSEYFASGLDLDEMAAFDTPERHLNLLMNLFEVMNHRAPIVSIVRGPAAGGGVGIALFSHIVIAGDKAKFVIPGKYYYRRLARLLIPVIRRRRSLEDPRIDLLLNEDYKRHINDIVFTPDDIDLVIPHPDLPSSDLDAFVAKAVATLEDQYFLRDAWCRYQQATTEEYVRFLRKHLKKKKKRENKKKESRRH